MKKGQSAPIPAADAEAEHFVESNQGEGGVGRASAETRAVGHYLAQIDGRLGHGGALGLEGAPGFHHQVFLRGTVDGTARARQCGGFAGSGGHYLEDVGPADGEHQHLQVVVAVGTTAQDVEALVARRKTAVPIACSAAQLQKAVV